MYLYIEDFGIIFQTGSILFEFYIWIRDPAELVQVKYLRVFQRTDVAQQKSQKCHYCYLWSGLISQKVQMSLIVTHYRLLAHAKALHWFMAVESMKFMHTMAWNGTQKIVVVHNLWRKKNLVIGHMLERMSYKCQISNQCSVWLWVANH